MSSPLAQQSGRRVCDGSSAQKDRAMLEGRLSVIAASAALLCGLLSCAWASQVYRLCPDKTVVQQFDPTRFTGLWYEIRRQPNLFEPDSICVTGNVSIDADHTVRIVNKWFNTVKSQHVVLNGTLRRTTNSSDDGKWLVNFFINNVDLDYWVLGTDYDNYAVIWSCWQTGKEEFTGYAWVLGRSKQLGEEHEAIVQDIEERNSVDTSLYEDTRQTDCPPLLQ